jgi:hypothetical protein
MSLFDDIDSMAESTKSSISCYIDYLVMNIKNKVLDIRAENEVLKKRLEEAKNGNNKESEIETRQV